MHVLPGNLLFASVLCAVALSVGCDAVNDFNSMIACQQYCDRNFECNPLVEPTDDRVRICVDNCRDSIEVQCGNENQQAANDHIFDCVEMGCAAFWTCMVFDSAPECYGFVTD